MFTLDKIEYVPGRYQTVNYEHHNETMRKIAEQLEAMKKEAEEIRRNIPAHCEICDNDFITKELESHINIRHDPHNLTHVIAEFIVYPVCPFCRTVKMYNPYITGSVSNE